MRSPIRDFGDDGSVDFGDDGSVDFGDDGSVDFGDDGFVDFGDDEGFVDFGGDEGPLASAVTRLVAQSSSRKWLYAEVLVMLVILSMSQVMTVTFS